LCAEMSALANLAAMLRPGAEEGSRAMTAHAPIDAVIAKMELQSKARNGRELPEDQQLEAVRQFWNSQEIRGFRDAYLLSWGLCLPHRPQGPCVLDDAERLQKVLDG